MNNIIRLFLIVLAYSTSIHSNAQQLKVIAYNVEFGKNTTPKEISALLKSENADVICFNEVPGQGWTKKVGRLLKLPYSSEGQTASADHTSSFKDKTGKHYGKYKSILSKYPLKDTHEISLDGIGWSPATAVVATINISEKQIIHIFSLHIPSGKKDPGKSKAFDLSQLLKQDYSDKDKLILAGDFNDLYDSESIKSLYDQGLKNSWKSLEMDLSGSTTLSRPEANGSVIDHIFYKGLKLKNAGIIEENTISDHKPVWSLFEL